MKTPPERRQLERHRPQPQPKPEVKHIALDLRIIRLWIINILIGFIIIAASAVALHYGSKYHYEYFFEDQVKKTIRKEIRRQVLEEVLKK